MKRFCKFVSDYMGVLVLLSALAALLFPDTVGHRRWLPCFSPTRSAT